MALTFLDKLKKRSLLTYYVLPQYKVYLKPNVLELVERTYLHSKTHDIYILSSDPIELLRYLPNKDVDLMLGAGVKSYVVLKNRLAQTDLEYLLEGKYSYLSPEFKSNVRLWGCMKDFDLGDDGLIYTDALLMALERHVVMKDFIQNDLGVELSEEQELLPCLGEEDFVSF